MKRKTQGWEEINDTIKMFDGRQLCFPQFTGEYDLLGYIGATTARSRIHKTFARQRDRALDISPKLEEKPHESVDKVTQVLTRHEGHHGVPVERAQNDARLA